jgi:hypothetical protein
MNAPARSDPAITKKALVATRRARDLLVALEACLVMLKNTSADPGGLTTGKSAASTSRKVSMSSTLLTGVLHDRFSDWRAVGRNRFIAQLRGEIRTAQPAPTSWRNALRLLRPTRA